MKALEDYRIVELYLARDETALFSTACKYGAKLRNLANSILDDPATAEECENDTYMEAWNLIPPHEPHTYLFAFLARITRNIALDCCRKRNRTKRSALLVELTDEMEQCIPSPSDTEGQVDGIILGEAISSFLRTLPQERRNVFIRRYWYMESIASVSKRFSMSESKVKSLLFRVRNDLRNYLIKEGYTL
ncbi:MAG: RNA polymerase sigma factor [Clostridia bacterium]|nr:RNA polymerase sigma factor [Clostridia bacterium]